MRVSLGSSFIGSFVDYVSLGDYPVSHICLGDGQIFPEDETTMRRITIETPPEGFMEWSYWWHATEAVNELVSPARYMRVKVDGTYYYVHSAFDNSPICQLKNDDLLFSADEAPLMQNLHVGDEIEIEAVIPKQCDTWYNNGPSKMVERAFFNPYLPGTIISGDCDKGQKKVCSHSRIRYEDKTLGYVFADCTHIGQGHNRNHQYYSWGTSHPNIEAIYESQREAVYRRGRVHHYKTVTNVTGYREIDQTKPTFSRRVDCMSWLGGSTHRGNSNLIYPEFKRIFKLKIKGVQ